MLYCHDLTKSPCYCRGQSAKLLQEIVADEKEQIKVIRKSLKFHLPSDLNNIISLV